MRSNGLLAGGIGFALLLSACSGSAGASRTTGPTDTPTVGGAELVQVADPLPLWQDETEVGTQRIVVISDIHLGIDDAFGETVKNKALLTDFLRRSAVSGIDEIVIAGDFLDEWFLPVSYPPHADSRDFYRKIKQNNLEVFAALSDVMDSGTTLTYVPGNHDMLLDQATLDELLPGIQQARDVAGLGTRRTGARSEVVIEHGHRYDAGAAPDSLSNVDVTGDRESILPFGYFVTRMIVTSLAEGKSAPVKDLLAIPPASGAADEQQDARAYAGLWSELMSRYPIAAGMDDPVFPAQFDGYPDAVSLRELVPAAREDGSIGATLYDNLHQRWDTLQAANGVAQPTPYVTALTTAFVHATLDAQAQAQYFARSPETDVVVFGHSHVPLLIRATAEGQQPKTYANSGTWIDHNTLGPSGTFVTIDSGADSTDVRVLQYRTDGTLHPVPNPK